MRKNPRRILSPQRLPFRHPGAGPTNLTDIETDCNGGAGPDLSLWMPKGAPGAAKLSVEHAAHLAILQLGGSG
jgi:hypothetical protein